MSDRSKRQEKIVWVNENDKRLAKSIASLRGMSLKEYFGVKVKEDASRLTPEVLRCGFDDWRRDR